ncbi:MAG: hypothetical protein KU29_00805 [Sulfurovum sp. FS06-10]|nr:MAG: hypothetical protein KU29_00805 [Sulfurovum sp. FS06-10]
MENEEKQAIILSIEKLVESDPTATPTPLALLHLLEIEDLIGIEQSLLKSKANRSKENEVWFDVLCKKG